MLCIRTRRVWVIRAFVGVLYKVFVILLLRRRKCWLTLLEIKTREIKEDKTRSSTFLIVLRWNECEILHSTIKLTPPKAQKRSEKTLDSFGSFLGNFLVFHHRFVFFLSFSAATSKNSFFFSRATERERERKKERKREIERRGSVLWLFVLFILKHKGKKTNWKFFNDSPHF